MGVLLCYDRAFKHILGCNVAVRKAVRVQEEEGGGGRWFISGMKQSNRRRKKKQKREEKRSRGELSNS